MKHLIVTFSLLICGADTLSAAQLSPINAEPSTSIVFNLTQNDDLWFFNGLTPVNYKTTVSLNAIGPTQGTFSWQVTSNQIAVNLENETDSITKGNGSLDVTSSQISLEPNDVTLNFKYGGENVGDYHFSVFAPANNRTQLLTLVHASAGSGTGFQSVAEYQLFDQFGNAVPRPLEVNEWFEENSIQDVVSNNWHSFVFPLEPNGIMTNSQNPSVVTDTYLRSGILLSPSGLPPGDPLSTTEVFNVLQRYNAGSLTPGQGRQVNAQTVHFYLDHVEPVQMQ